MTVGIHLYIEGKGENNKWFVAHPRYVNYSSPDNFTDISSYPVRKNRNLIQVIANLYDCEKIPLIQKNDGLPDDVSEEVRALSHEESFFSHSHCWIEIADIDKYIRQHQSKADEDIQDVVNNFKDIYRECCYLSEHIINDYQEPLPMENIRLVFWFDS